MFEEIQIKEFVREEIIIYFIKLILNCFMILFWRASTS